MRMVVDSERLGFVDQHDGDAVLDGVHKAAGLADQRLRSGPVLQLTLAFRADQNLEELGGQSHADSFGVAGKPNRASAPELFRQFGSVLTQQSRYTGAPISSSSRARA